MANRFRSVPSRLCCTNYIKAAHIPYVENTFGLKQPIRQPPTNWNCMQLKNENLIDKLESFHLNGINFKKDVWFSNRQENVTWFHSNTRSRGNELNVLPLQIKICKSTRVMSSSSNSKGEASRKSEPEGDVQGRPSEEQLEYIFKSLSSHLPRIFAIPLPANDYHPEIILENNIKKKRTIGLKSYVYQLALVKMLAHWKFAYVRLQILKITKHPEDGSVKVRWRVVGIPGLKVIFQFWKYNLLDIQKNCDEAPTWIDGFSIYYVGDDGKIVKHVLDKMQPDDDRVSANPKTTIASKVVMFLKSSQKMQHVCSP